MCVATHVVDIEEAQAHFAERRAGAAYMEHAPDIAESIEVLSSDIVKRLKRLRCREGIVPDVSFKPLQTRLRERPFHSLAVIVSELPGFAQFRCFDIV